MHLMQKSHQVNFIDTTPKETCIVMPKGNIVQLNPDDEDIFATQIHDRYASHPVELENMTLAHFATKFAVVYSGKSNDTELGQTEPNELEIDENNYNHEETEDKRKTTINKNHITLLNGLGKMSKRTQDAVLHTHRYHKEKDPYTYYYSHVLLFLPWHNEDDLVQNQQQIYDEHCLLIEKNAEYFNQHEQEIDAATVYLQQHGPPEHVWDTIAPAAQAQNISDELEGPSTIRDMDEDDLATLNDEEQLSQLSSALNKQFTKEANKDIMTNREYCKAYCSLNDEQRTVVLFNRNWCKMAVAALRNGKAIPAYQLYVSGPGGTGKSYIIKMIHHDINYFFNLYEKREQIH